MQSKFIITDTVWTRKSDQVTVQYSLARDPKENALGT